MKSKHNSAFLRCAKFPILAALALVASSQTSLQASAIMVNWGGDYVDADANQSFSGSYSYQGSLDLDGDSSADDSRFGYAYDSDNPSPLSPSNNYSGTSSMFYGGFVVNTINASSNGDSLQPSGEGVFDGNGGGDYIKFQTQHSGNHHHTFALFTYWDQNDFLNGGDTATITLDTLSSFSLTILDSSNFTDSSHLHFVIRNGEQFYVSEAFYSGVSSFENGYLGVIPDGGTVTYNPLVDGYGWRLYDPDGLDLQWTHGDYDAIDFNNITAVGFYFDTLVFSQNTNRLNVSNFSFTAVPEPSTAVLSIGGIGMMLLVRRRR